MRSPLLNFFAGTHTLPFPCTASTSTRVMVRETAGEVHNYSHVRKLESTATGTPFGAGTAEHQSLSGPAQLNRDPRLRSTRIDPVHQRTLPETLPCKHSHKQMLHARKNFSFIASARNLRNQQRNQLSFSCQQHCVLVQGVRMAVFFEQSLRAAPPMRHSKSRRYTDLQEECGRTYVEEQPC